MEKWLHDLFTFHTCKLLPMGYLCFPALAAGPNLYLTAPAPNLYFTAPALNLCLPVLRFTVKVCYSYSVYLNKPFIRNGKASCFL